MEGIVHASRYDPNAPRKQFLGATIECGDGKEWVIDYDEQSPYHSFADRQVVVSGEPYQPDGQQIGGGRIAGHLLVSTMRLVDLKADAELVEIGPGQRLSGRFERGPGDIGEPMLSFVTDKGDAFVVANDPAGVSVGPSVEVWAYPVQPSPSIQKPPGRYL